jgi:hypothetical protein
VVLAVVVVAAAYLIWRMRRAVSRGQTSCCDAGANGRCPLQSSSKTDGITPADDVCRQCPSRPD